MSDVTEAILILQDVETLPCEVPKVKLTLRFLPKLETHDRGTPAQEIATKLLYMIADFNPGCELEYEVYNGETLIREVKFP